MALWCAFFFYFSYLYFDFFQTRAITVREPSGRLRKASWEERDRLNFIYFPKPGRQYEMPELLTDEGMLVM